MIITDLSYFDDLHESKVAVQGGHSYSKSYDFQSLKSLYSGKVSEYLKNLDISKYLDESAYSKYADCYGKYTATKASTYKHGETSYSYSMDVDSTH